MTISVDIYKGLNKLGSGTAAAASTSITSYSANLSRALGTNRNVQITPTTGNNVGLTFKTRVTNDGGATVTIADPCPFS